MMSFQVDPVAQGFRSSPVRVMVLGNDSELAVRVITILERRGFRPERVSVPLEVEEAARRGDADAVIVCDPGPSSRDVEAVAGLGIPVLVVVSDLSGAEKIPVNLARADDWVTPVA